MGMKSLKDKPKKEVEYEDAPSGYITLYNYKEPFMKFEEGYGYQGVLAFDGETEKVQCHFCGDWFGQLPHHIHREHNMRAQEYKALVGLAPTTALVNEHTRKKMIESGLEKRAENLRPGVSPSKATRDKIAKTLRENRREMQNVRGTCPEQLLDRLRKHAEKLGRTPKEREITYHSTLKSVFGSVRNAVELAGLEPRPYGQTVNNPRLITKEKLVKEVVQFLETHKRLPRFKDFNAMGKKNLWEKMIKVGWKDEVFKEALCNTNKYIRVKHNKIRLDKADLIKFMQNFKERHHRNPTTSDAKRGLLPYPSQYIYHFGSWAKALNEAFGE